MDAETFDSLYTESFNRLVGQIYAMCGSLAEAQDCVQEAFIRAWDRRAQSDASAHPEAWVRTTAYRLAVSRWRKWRRGRRDPDRALESSAPSEPDPALVDLRRALEKLTPDQRRTIVLFHLCDMSVADVAAELGVPTGTVKARLSRGRAALAAELGDAYRPEVSDAHH